MQYGKFIHLLIDTHIPFPWLHDVTVHEGSRFWFGLAILESNINRLTSEILPPLPPRRIPWAPAQAVDRTGGTLNNR